MSMDPLLFDEEHTKHAKRKCVVPPDNGTLDLFREALPPHLVMHDPTFDATEDAYVAPPGRLGETFDPDLDGARLATATARVLWLMCDGQPHTLEELRALGGAQGERRVRELRDARFGFSISSKRVSGGQWEYRMAEPTVDQLRAAERVLKVPVGTYLWGAT